MSGEVEVVDDRTHYLISTRVDHDRYSVRSVGGGNVMVGHFFRDGLLWRIDSPYATRQELLATFEWSGDAYRLLWQISLREGFSTERG